jgi:hypothetical protein
VRPGRRGAAAQAAAEAAISTTLRSRGFARRSIKSNKAAVIRARYNELLSRLGESIGVEGVIAQIPARQGPSTTQAAPTTSKPSQFAEDVRSVDQVHGQV